MPSIVPPAALTVDQQEKKRVDIYHAAVKTVDVVSEALNPTVVAPKVDIADEEDILIPVPKVTDYVWVGRGKGSLDMPGFVTKVLGGGRRGRINCSVMADGQPGIQCIQGANYYKDPRTIQRMNRGGYEPTGRWMPMDNTQQKLVLLVQSLLDRVQKLEDGRK
jgi:hypothetical protein